MRNRILLSKISQYGYRGYWNLKDSLAPSGHGHLVQYLTDQEDNVLSELDQNRHDSLALERLREVKRMELEEARRNAGNQGLCEGLYLLV